MRKILILVLGLSLSACASYDNYAQTLPQYKAHNPNRCYSNMSFYSLTPSDPRAATMVATVNSDC